MRVCGNCGASLEDEVKKCPNCGKSVCENCGNVLGIGVTKCPKCGQATTLGALQGCGLSMFIIGLLLLAFIILVLLLTK